MTRAFVAGVVLGLVVGWIATARGDELPDETVEAASEAGVDPVDLLGAQHSTGLEPREYLWAVGELPTSRFATWVACIERAESGGMNVWNRQGSGAGGTLQYMDSTFRAHAAEMGRPDYSRWVPWQARAVAAWDLAHGRRSQWAVSGC